MLPRRHGGFLRGVSGGQHHGRGGGGGGTSPALFLLSALIALGGGWLHTESKGQGRIPPGPREKGNPFPPYRRGKGNAGRLWLVMPCGALSGACFFSRALPRGSCFFLGLRVAPARWERMKVLLFSLSRRGVKGKRKRGERRGPHFPGARRHRIKGEGGLAFLISCFLRL